MSRQVAIRLPSELVAYMDRTVQRGDAQSRAELVAEAIEWRRRRELAERDAAILASGDYDDYDDFDELAEYAARTPMDDLE